MLERLMEIDEVSIDGNGVPYWTSCGKAIAE